MALLNEHCRCYQFDWHIDSCVSLSVSNKMVMNSKLCAVIVALCVAFPITYANFDLLDANHDGAIDRDEFKKIAPAVEDFLKNVPESVIPVLEDVGFISALFNSLVRCV
jgi:hypothetical protein